MFAVGQVVRVLSPFAESFADEYKITEVVTHDDGQMVCILGDAGGFAPIYLRLVE